MNDETWAELVKLAGAYESNPSYENRVRMMHAIDDARAAGHPWEDIDAATELPSTLDETMSFGRVIEVLPSGRVQDSDEFGPEVVYVELDADEQIIDASCNGIDMTGYYDWELLEGFTGQHGYSGPIMHESEYIGGGLAAHILSHPGHYVVVSVDGWLPESNDDEVSSVSVGWAVAFKPADE